MSIRPTSPIAGDSRGGVGHGGVGVVDKKENM